jgi:hypothetical protein
MSMIELTNKPTAPGQLPRLMGLKGAMRPKEVSVVQSGAPQLEAGEWVVLTTAGGAAYELVSRADVPSGVDQGGTGTYVDSSVIEQVGQDVDNPTLHLYNRADVIKKVSSRAGAFLAASTLLAIATAGLGLWFEFGGDSGPSASVTAAKARTLLAWATEPELRIEASATPAAIAAARNELDRRQRKANDCLEGLRGGNGAPPTVDGVACSASSPSFWRDKDNAGLVAGVVGVLAVLLAGVGSVKQFAAGRNPSD